MQDLRRGSRPNLSLATKTLLIASRTRYTSLTMRSTMWGGLSLVSIFCVAAGCGGGVADELQLVGQIDDEVAVRNCTAGTRPSPGLELTPAFDRLTFSRPVALVQAKGDRTRFYLAEKGGRILLLSKDSHVSSVFADLRSMVNAVPNEGGLLGVALHPDFLTNGEVYLSYTAPSSTAATNLRSVIARAKTRDSGRTLDVSSLEEILTFDQPFTNHNGGHVAFGPDGYLYIGFGDGGSDGDPLRYGQDKSVFFGKILRIDVNRTSGYGIPTDNPFAVRGGKPEIYAYGLRNPWKFTFDSETGDLWCGDVGQNTLEEIDKIVKGGNYGWSEREGNRCFRAGCSTAGFVEPVVTYPRADGVSVTGGFVYRGVENPSLFGSYIYGDFGSGRIWALPPGGRPRVLFETTGLNPSSFGEDADGEIYVLDFSSGKVFFLSGGGAVGGPPRKLSATGCFSRADTRLPSSRLVPYTVNAPFWSDGSDKERYIALPTGAGASKISVGANGDWDLPLGSVAVKTFSIGTTRVETRLFMRHTDGTWAGYTYEWNAAQTDATLLTTGKTKTVAGQEWTYPGRGECMSCHQSSAGFTLGLETAQLDRDETIAGRTENQLTRLRRLGVFAAGATFTGVAPLPSYTDRFATTETKARAYLQANCSFCHQPGSLGRGMADYRFSTPLAGMGICNATPEASLGIAGAKVIAPGAPDRSVLSLRIHATDDRRMPPISSNLVDPVGSALIDAWIRGIASCPAPTP